MIKQHLIEKRTIGDIQQNKPCASKEWSAIRLSNEKGLFLFKCGSKYATGNVEPKAPKHEPKLF